MTGPGWGNAGQWRPVVRFRHTPYGPNWLVVIRYASGVPDQEWSAHLTLPAAYRAAVELVAASAPASARIGEVHGERWRPWRRRRPPGGCGRPCA